MDGVVKGLHRLSKKVKKKKKTGVPYYEGIHETNQIHLLNNFSIVSIKQE